MTALPTMPLTKHMFDRLTAKNEGGERMKPTCESCTYYQPKTDLIEGGKAKKGGKGECRKNAPVALDLFYGWPPVLYSDWCGEYKKSKEFCDWS